jgi:hypothetical protein
MRFQATLELISPLGPDTHDWLLWATSILVFLALAALGIWSVILEHRHTGPYTLKAASSKQKWLWSVTQMFWITLLLPLIGLVEPILSPHPDQWPTFPMICLGVWIVAYPLAVLYKRLNLEIQLKAYHSMDKYIKSGRYERLSSSPFLRWRKWFMSKELKRFYEEGYPEDETDKKPPITV